MGEGFGLEGEGEGETMAGVLFRKEVCVVIPFWMYVFPYASMDLGDFQRAIRISKYSPNPCSLS